jgi:required for meiotic nuclear division protein 1
MNDIPLASATHLESGPEHPRGLQHDLLLQAHYFEGQIDLRAFATKHPHYPVISANPLVLQPETGRWIYVERFGVVVFWNCTETIIQTFHSDLHQIPGVGKRAEAAEDRLNVHVNAEADRVGFSEVWLRELLLDKLKIVSLTLAQSVALDFFEQAVKAAMTRLQPVIHGLRDEGRLLLSHREALKTVGFAMAVQAAVLDNLTLFDDPPETWESESLAHLDSALYDQFDLEERLSAINQKVNYLTDAGARVMDVLTHRKDQNLEWIVIILIAVEIVFFIWLEMAHPGMP